MESDTTNQDSRHDHDKEEGNQEGSVKSKNKRNTDNEDNDFPIDEEKIGKYAEQGKRWFQKFIDWLDSPVEDDERKGLEHAEGFSSEERLRAAFTYTVLGAFYYIWQSPTKNAFIRFHAIQAIGIFLLGSAAYAALAGSAVITSGLSVIAGGPIVGFAWFFVHVYGAFKAYQGEAWEFPITGDIARKNA